MASEREPVAVAVPSEAELTALAAEYYEVVQNDIHKERDCHWQISERWSYGEHVGWFVEHYGYLHELVDGEYGGAGPYSSRGEALRHLAEQLRAAIADVGSWHGG